MLERPSRAFPEIATIAVRVVGTIDPAMVIAFPQDARRSNTSVPACIRRQMQHSARIRTCVDRFAGPRRALECGVLGANASNQRIETPLADIASAFVSEGLGVTIVNPFSAVKFLHRGIVARRFVPTVDAGTAMVMDRHREPSRVAREFVAQINERIDRYLSILDCYKSLRK